MSAYEEGIEAATRAMNQSRGIVAGHRIEAAVAAFMREQLAVGWCAVHLQKTGVDMSECNADSDRPCRIIPARMVPDE